MGLLLSIFVLAVIVFLAFVAFVGYKMVKPPPRLVEDWTPKDLALTTRMSNLPQKTALS